MPRPKKDEEKKKSIINNNVTDEEVKAISEIDEDEENKEVVVEEVIKDISESSKKKYEDKIAELEKLVMEMEKKNEDFVNTTNHFVRHIPKFREEVKIPSTVVSRGKVVARND